MMDKGSENFVSAFAFGYFCLRENKMLFLQYGNDEDEEIFLRLAFMQSLGGAGCCTIFFSCDGQSNRPDEPSTGGRGFRVSCFDRYCACGARLRPILMTSLAMVVGLLPLMFAFGVGAHGNRTLGTASIGGMLIGMICQIFIVPVLFVIFQYLQEKVKPMEWEDIDNTDAVTEIEQYAK